MWKSIAVSSALLLLAYWFFPTDDKLVTLKGKRVLITGASQGIGEEIAYQYAKYGASTVITSRRQEVLEKVAKKCKSLGPPDATHTAISADMFDLASISNLIEKTIKQLGGLDIVVLNHIGASKLKFFDGSKELKDFVYKTMDINFKSYVEVTGLVLPYLTKTNGNLVVVNSLTGIIPFARLGAYSASKFALNGFFNSLRSQFIMEERNVTVTMCYLGSIDTYNAYRLITEANLTRVQKYSYRAPVNDTAFAIVRAGARREDTMYYPTSVRVHVTLYPLFTSLYDYGIRELFRY